MMMMAEGTLSFSVAEVVEDVLQQHGTRLRDLDLASRKAEEAGNFFFFWVKFISATKQRIVFLIMMMMILCV